MHRAPRFKCVGTDRRILDHGTIALWTRETRRHLRHAARAECARAVALTRLSRDLTLHGY